MAPTPVSVSAPPASPLPPQGASPAPHPPPPASRSPSASASPGAAPPSRRARHTILVVDDEPDVVKSVKDLLRLDYKVLGATSPQEGMAILRREDVHVVMTDQRMPDMTGVQFLSRIRSENHEATRLLFTGYADIRAVIDAINEGNVYRYITKPWDPDDLQTVIREACERYDLLLERKKLLEILQQQNKDLEKANADLRRANELKHAFIQVASHELRTPLTILQGMTKLAMQMPGVGEPLKGFLGRIERAAQRLQHLVNQIIAMLTAGRFERPLEPTPTDMAALLTEAADDVRPFVELRRQVLNVDVPADLGTLDVEAPRIRDTLNHLLLNAIKFTADGGTITLAADRVGDVTGVDAEAAPDGRALRVRVADTGMGMDAAHCERLFEPFFTGYDVSRHSSGTYEHGRKGLGLGLSLVKAFVDMHGGKVLCDSQPGKGTTFTLTLPARPPAHPAEQPAQQPAERPAAQPAPGPASQPAA